MISNVTAAAAATVLAALGASGLGSATAAEAPGGTSLELNKLEPTDKGCRAHVVINNTGDTAYQSFKLDLVEFQTDGVIGKRLIVDLAPLKAQKKIVKAFEVEGLACDKIGSFLINDVTECKGDTGPVADCLKHLALSTLTPVQLSK